MAAPAFRFVPIALPGGGAPGAGEQAVKAQPVFYGDASRDRHDAELWLQSMDNHFRQYGVGDQAAISQAVGHFAGNAREWWFNHATLQDDFDQTRLRDEWLYFCECFLQRFATLRTAEDPVADIGSLTQQPNETTEMFILRLSTTHTPQDALSRQRSAAKWQAQDADRIVHANLRNFILNLGLADGQRDQATALCLQACRHAGSMAAKDRSKDVAYEAVARQAARGARDQKMRAFITGKMFSIVPQSLDKLMDTVRLEEMRNSDGVRKKATKGGGGQVHAADAETEAAADSDGECDAIVGKKGGKKNKKKGKGKGKGGGQPSADAPDSNKDKESDKSGPTCDFCKNVGHRQNECRTKKRLQQQYLERKESRGNGNGPPVGRRFPANAASGEYDQQQQHYPQQQQQQQFYYVPPPNYPQQQPTYSLREWSMPGYQDFH